MFDAEDLSSEGAFVLVAGSARRLFVWLGSEFAEAEGVSSGRSDDEGDDDGDDRTTALDVAKKIAEEAREAVRSGLRVVGPPVLRQQAYLFVSCDKNCASGKAPEATGPSSWTCRGQLATQKGGPWALRWRGASQLSSGTFSKADA